MKIRGFIDYIFYPRTGLDKDKNIQYAGMKIQCADKKKIKCLGMVPQVSIGDYLEFEGDFVDDGAFKFTTALRVDDDAIGATSMLIYVFGPKSAQKVISNFTGDAMKAWELFKNHEDIFRNEMSKVKGIGKKKLEKAYAKYENHIAVDMLFTRFSKYGLLLNKALAVYEAWGDKSLKKIEENPYNLIYIDKIPFQVMDKIARLHYKFSDTDNRRIYAGVLKIMKSINMMGHTFIRFSASKYQGESTLLDLAEELLKVDKSLIREEIFNLVDDNKLILDKQEEFDIIYLPHMYKAEKGVASYAKGMIEKNDIDVDAIDMQIENYENVHKITLADKQKDAIRTSAQNKFSIISGPPGSGKTTIIDCICSIFTQSKKGCQIKLAAPTGKAAKRMTESTGMRAETVHRLLKYNPHDGDFIYNSGNPLPADVIIIDEFSMMPVLLTYKLLAAIPKHCTVILVGDKNQLPSVDAGQVLEDFLAADFVPKTILDKIYRQDDKSTILKRALALSNDVMPDLDDSDDFTFWEEEDSVYLKQGLLSLYYNECATYGIDNVLLLTPMNKNDLGVDALNEVIQEHYNPHVDGMPEIKSGKRCFRKNDRVIQLTNEDEYDVFNGMVGKIIKVVEEDKETGEKECITVDYGDVVCEYTRDRFDNIKHAYALTIHKCQGSEAKSVIVICHHSHKFMLRKKLLYTAMTRAKNHLHLVGEKQMVTYSLRNKEPIRNSKLLDFLNGD